MEKENSIQQPNFLLCSELFLSKNRSNILRLLFFLHFSISSDQQVTRLTWAVQVNRRQITELHLSKNKDSNLRDRIWMQQTRSSFCRIHPFVDWDPLVCTQYTVPGNSTPLFPPICVSNLNQGLDHCCLLWKKQMIDAAYSTEIGVEQHVLSHWRGFDLGCHVIVMTRWFSAYLMPCISGVI